MSEVERETLVGTVGVGGGGTSIKIAVKIPDDGEAPSDLPPESFWLSKDEESDWLNRNAVLLRKESTRGGSITSNLSSSNNRSPNFNSARVSIRFKQKAHVLGLPKTQRTTFADPNWKSYRSANTPLIPKKSKSLGTLVEVVTEPTSPKVSCVGKVRARRCNQQSKSVRNEKSAENGAARCTDQKTGLFSMLLSLFRSKKGRKKQARSRSRRVVEEPPAANASPRKSGSVKSPGITERAEPPGLGVRKRFSSGRWSESLISDDCRTAA